MTGGDGICTRMPKF